MDCQKIWHSGTTQTGPSLPLLYHQSFTDMKIIPQTTAASIPRRIYFSEQIIEQTDFDLFLFIVP